MGVAAGFTPLMPPRAVPRSMPIRVVAPSPPPLHPLQTFDSPMESFVGWLCEQLTNSRNNNAAMRAAVAALTILLRREAARILFSQNGGIGYLTKLLKMQGAGANAQLLYELTFCLWTLSYCEEVKYNFQEQGTIAVLCEQVTAAPR